MRKPFSTTIEEDVQKKFKEKCGEMGFLQNVVLENFMKDFVSGEFEIKLIRKSESIESGK